MGILADIINTVSATGTNIIHATSKLMKNEKAQIEIMLRFEDLEHLKEITSRIKRIKSINSIRIIEPKA